MPYGTSSSYKGGAPAKKKKAKKPKKGMLGKGMARKAASKMKERYRLINDL